MRSHIDVGPARVLLGAGNPQRTVARVFSEEDQEGTAAHAMIVGPGGTQLEVTYFLADSGEGLVSCTDIGPSDPAFRRLAHGARMGVYVTESGERVIKRLRLLRWDPEAGWGNPGMTDCDELDEVLGASAEALLLSSGVTDIGTARELLDGRTSDLAVIWPPEAGAGPAFVAYALTRVLPVISGSGLSDD